MTATAAMLRPHDLTDADRFVTIKSIPVLDQHTSDEKGDVDTALLRLLATNSNRRVEEGDPPSIHVGHLRRKTSIIVVHADGSRTVMPGAREEDQPPLIGFTSHYHVAPYQGRPALHCDFHVFPEHVGTLKKMVWRSAERLEPTDGRDKTSHVIDRVAVLASPPERPLGALTVHQYERADRSTFADRSGIRISYERPCRGGGCVVAVPGPTPKQRRRVDEMIDQATVRRIAYEAAIDAVVEVGRYRDQIEGVEQLRRQGYAISDATADRISALPVAEYEREVQNVRTHYARGDQNNPGPIIPGTPHGDRAIAKLAIERAIKNRWNYYQSKAAVLADLGYSVTQNNNTIVPDTQATVPTSRAIVPTGRAIVR